MLDQFGGSCALAATVTACGGVTEFVYRLLSPEFVGYAVVAFFALASSEGFCKGWAHALMHAVWHWIVFTLPWQMYLGGIAAHSE